MLTGEKTFTTSINMSVALDQNTYINSSLTFLAFEEDLVLSLSLSLTKRRGVQTPSPVK